MKIVKKILLGIVILIVLLLVVALFVSKEYSVEREVTINKPKQEVFDYVKVLKNQDQYNKWVMADPNVQRDYKGTDGTVGFITTWESKKSDVGKGEQEIKNVTEGNKIESEVRFEKPMKGVANVFMSTDSVTANQTKVKWGMAGKNPYPMNIMNLFIPSMLGKDMQQSLGTLKSILEK
ncbi:MAG: polyketide cyclase [Chitinophagaceae bacterium]|nr:polyketide cyclase [Chitinophagaceae bacterium]